MEKWNLGRNRSFRSSQSLHDDFHGWEKKKVLEVLGPGVLSIFFPFLRRFLSCGGRP